MLPVAVSRVVMNEVGGSLLGGLMDSGMAVFPEYVIVLDKNWMILYDFV